MTPEAVSESYASETEPRQAAAVYKVSDGTFEKEVLQTEGLVLLDFWAEWCIPCLEIEPVLEKMAVEFDGRVKICKINVEGNSETVAEYVPDNIFPCLVLLRNGEVLDRKYGTTPGMQPHVFFRGWFSEYLEDR